LGIVTADIIDQQRARYDFIDVIPVHSRPSELLRNL
jgi:hypothetical protein